MNKKSLYFVLENGPFRVFIKNRAFLRFLGRALIGPFGRHRPYFIYLLEIELDFGLQDIREGHQLFAHELQ